MNTIKKPYLIQRGQIKRPLLNYKDQKLSDAVVLEYMGSAEFEFGALPDALRQLQSVKDDLKQGSIGSIQDLNGQPLRVLHTFTPKAFEEYAQHILAIWNNDGWGLKEGAYFGQKSLQDRFRSKTDFWWDIENNVMWSFDKDFMNNLTHHLDASFDFMDASRPQKEPSM